MVGALAGFLAETALPTNANPVIGNPSPASCAAGRSRKSRCLSFPHESPTVGRPRNAAQGNCDVMFSIRN